MTEAPTAAGHSDVDIMPAATPAPGAEIKVRVHLLQIALKRVWHAIAKDDSRPVLACVCLEGDADGLRLVAANNYQIATQRLSLEPHTDWGTALIHRTWLPLLRQYLSGISRADVVLAKQAEALEVSGGPNGVALTLPLLGGPFPRLTVPVVQARPVTISPVLLGGMARALTESAHVLGHLPMRLWLGPTANDPLSVTMGDHRTESYYHEVLMPVRSRDDEPPPTSETQVVEPMGGTVIDALRHQQLRSHDYNPGGCSACADAARLTD